MLILTLAQASPRCGALAQLLNSFWLQLLCKPDLCNSIAGWSYRKCEASSTELTPSVKGECDCAPKERRLIRFYWKVKVFAGSYHEQGRSNHFEFYNEFYSEKGYRPSWNSEITRERRESWCCLTGGREFGWNANSQYDWEVMSTVVLCFGLSLISS